MGRSRASAARARCRERPALHRRGLTTLAAAAIDYAAAGNALTLYFVPAADWNGSTSFQFTATDARRPARRHPATRTINVAPVNDAPVANRRRRQRQRGRRPDRDHPHRLGRRRPDHELPDRRRAACERHALHRSVLTPRHRRHRLRRRRQRADPVLRPGSQLERLDQLPVHRHRAGGLADVTPATATINVAAVNDAPVANNVLAGGNEDDAQIAITLTGADVDGSIASFRLPGCRPTALLYTDAGLTTLAAAGPDYAAAGNALTLYFVPAANWSGSTSFQFTATDAGGLSDATPATATINVAPVNDAPVRRTTAAATRTTPSRSPSPTCSNDVLGDRPIAIFGFDALSAQGGTVAARRRQHLVVHPGRRLPARTRSPTRSRTPTARARPQPSR